MSMTVRDIEQLVIDTAVKVVEAGAAAKATPDSWFAEFDEYAAQVASKARPLIIKSIADDEEEFDQLQAMTENLVDAAEFAMAILDRALTYAGPLLALL